MQLSHKFYPISFSWVAFHTKPKGIILFIGGAFFGSFPTVSYEYLLKQLFFSGYTVIVLPFRFTFSHWSVALSLLEEERVVRQRIVSILKKSGFSAEDYEIYLNNKNYIWLGHSLGCKYIALLELLADWQNESDKTRDLIKSCTRESDEYINEIMQRIRDIKISFKDQRSIIVAPDISSTNDAIPIPFLPQILDGIGLGVNPTQKETFNLIKASSLFNLTAMISFSEDHQSGSIKDTITSEKTTPWLLENLKSKLLHKEIKGQHLRPLGCQLNGTVIGPLADPPIDLVPTILDFINQLEQRTLSFHESLFSC